MKKCISCLELFPPEKFHQDKSKKDGRVSSCKSCKKSYRRHYYQSNRQALVEYSRGWYFNNKEAAMVSSDKWRLANRDRVLSNRRKYHKRRYSLDAGYRLNVIIRSMLRRTLAATDKPKDFITFTKIGYTSDDLRKRIEMNFKPGMSWENTEKWEIDHRVPVAVMVAKGETRPDVINCLANLVPLWAEENRSKGARYVS